MPYLYGVSSGLYLARRRAEEKSVDWHYGIVDVGNRLCEPRSNGLAVIHQTPPQVRFDTLWELGPWAVLRKVDDEFAAIGRLRLALSKPLYDPVLNNCEHFANWIASARRESPQLQHVVGTVAVVALVVWLLSS